MELIVPVAVGIILLYGMIKKTKIFDAFIEGAIEGMHTLYMIIPTIKIQSLESSNVLGTSSKFEES